MEIEKTKRIVARCDARLKRKIERVEKESGVNESAIIRASVEHFFAQNKTTAEIICAVHHSRITP